MNPRMSEYLSVEFFKFLVVSIFAAMINFGSRIFFSQFMEYSRAILFAFCCGLTTAFLLNKLFVFQKGKEKAIKQFTIFFTVNIVALFQTLIVSLFFREWFFPFINFQIYIDEISHLIGIGIPVFTSYFAHKYFSFRK